MLNEGATPDQPEESEDNFFGNETVDLTPWLIEYVRVSLAEYSSTLYDQLTPTTIELVVRTTLQGMAAAEGLPPEITHEGESP